MILALAFSIAGCAARKAGLGHSAQVPGCIHAYAFVPRGCYLQNFEDRIEVRCPESTTIFRKCVKR
jgi:hypothetical protein